MEKFNSVKIFSTRETSGLSRKIFEHAQMLLALSGVKASLGEIKITRFSNGNIQAQVGDVRGDFAVIIHSQGKGENVHDSLFEFFAIVHAISNARPADILVVFPYMPYVRSDVKNSPRISVMGEFLPKIISKILGVKRVLLLDPHAGHIKHYFHPAADQISAVYLLANEIKKELKNEKREVVVVFPDAGAAKRFENFPSLLGGVPTAYIDKGRPDDEENPIPRQVVGNVKGKTVIMIDDEILTGRTATREGILVKNEGVKRIWMVAIHPIFSGEAVENFQKGPFDRVFITNTIPGAEEKLKDKIFKIVPTEKLIAEAIKRIVLEESLTKLHSMEAVRLYL